MEIIQYKDETEIYFQGYYLISILNKDISEECQAELLEANGKPLAIKVTVVGKATPQVLKFNTGRLYTKFGQRIAAIRVGHGVYMRDVDRMIAYYFKYCDMTKSDIMFQYDKNLEGPKPYSNEELMSKIKAFDNYPVSELFPDSKPL